MLGPVLSSSLLRVFYTLTISLRFLAALSGRRTASATATTTTRYSTEWPIVVSPAACAVSHISTVTCRKVTNRTVTAGAGGNVRELTCNK